ncbi:hypothetical protein ZWY2020_014138 [Hordeum vulgare]|nr:hypothetical protein ZWY2020_014138 [Hordeum vulgare]
MESSTQPTQHKSVMDGFGTPERCTTEYPFLKRKAKEADQDQDEEEEHEKEKEMDEILATAPAKLPRRADVVSVPVAAAESMVVDPLVEQDIAKATVSEPQADAEEIKEPVSEAEDKDVYDDEDADYDYQDDPDYDGYYDEDDYEDDDYDYDDYDWESEFAKHRPAVRAALLTFPEAANLEPQELDGWRGPWSSPNPSTLTWPQARFGFCQRT